MIKTEFILSGEFQENCYIVYDNNSKKAIIIDPGQDGKKVIDKIEKLKLKPELLINTHGHFDHTFSDDIIRQKYNIPLAIHKDDTDMLSDAGKKAQKALDDYAKLPDEKKINPQGEKLGCAKPCTANIFLKALL